MTLVFRRTAGNPQASIVMSGHTDGAYMSPLMEAGLLEAIRSPLGIRDYS